MYSGGVAGTGILVAAAAGAAVAVRMRRKGPHDAATFHVNLDDGEGWAIWIEGSDDPIQKFRTKSMAVRAARKAAADSAPSDLLIHLSDGTVQATHSYEQH